MPGAYDETRLTRFALDAVYASIGSRKLCRDASTCPGTRQRHGSARQHGSQRFRQPRTAWSASRKCSLRRQDKATSHCVVVGFIWPRGQHETAGMQGSGERGRAQRRTLLGYGHRELKQEGRPLLAQSGHFGFWRGTVCPLMTQSGHPIPATKCPFWHAARIRNGHERPPVRAASWPGVGGTSVAACRPIRGRRQTRDRRYQSREPGQPAYWPAHRRWRQCRGTREQRCACP